MYFSIVSAHADVVNLIPRTETPPVVKSVVPRLLPEPCLFLAPDQANDLSIRIARPGNRYRRA